VGAILIKPLDPVATIGGAEIWNTPLPERPVLVFGGEADADLPFPMVDFLYERRRAPMVAVTIGGAAHMSTCDGCALEPGAQPTIDRAQEWAVTNAYAVTFLDHVTKGDLSRGVALFGRGGLSTTLSTAGVWVQADRRMDAPVVDDYQDDVVGRNALGLGTGAVGLLAGTPGEEPWLLEALRALPDTYTFARELFGRPALLAHTRARRLEWTAAADPAGGDGVSYGSELGGLHAGGRTAFVLRARVPQGRVPAEALAVRFVDGAQRTVTLPLPAAVGRNGLGRHFSNVVVPLAEVAAAGLDLDDLARVELRLSGAGQLVVDDLRFE
jgi:hypothetical protein